MMLSLNKRGNYKDLGRGESFSSERMSDMHNKFTIVCVNICVFIFLLIGIELVGQTYYFFKRDKFIFQGKKFVNDELFERHPYLGTRVKKSVIVQRREGVITTTGIGTRWTGASEDDEQLIRVALVGGSTTFGSMAGDRDTWAALLQGLLGDQYAVINYGTAGYTTAENIIQMALIVPEKDPDIVIFYEGWNDISNYHDQKLGPDYYTHGIKQIEGNMENDRFKNTDWLWFQASERIFFFKLTHIIRQLLVKKSDALPLGFDTPDPFVDRIYLRNLKTLKLLALQMNPETKVMFVPQILNYAAFQDKKPRIWSRYINDNAMPKLMDRFNQIMNEVCQPGESRCIVVNEVLKVNWESADFRDDGHFNYHGGAKFAPVIADKIKEIGKYK